MMCDVRCMAKSNNIMVTVCVVTYNQEQWIRQTLDSILAQKTNYPFEVIIGEDHGTDGTRGICQEYADTYKNVTLMPLTDNLGVTANWIRCVQAGTGKYIMTCAGDDWWHNENKIQLQVDYMESHPECVVCHTDIDEYNELTAHTIPGIKHAQGIIPPEGKIQKEILAGKEYISAVTMCIRRETFEKYIPADEFARRKFPREDWPTLLILSSQGEINYLPVSTATYRVGQESITRTSDYEKIFVRVQRDKEMTEYLYSQFPELGEYTAGDYFDNIGYHYALLAAYRNNDYCAARKFARMDKYPTKGTRMARTWLTFNLFRILQKYRDGESITHKLKNSTKLREFIRFGIVGTLSTVMHYGLYYLLNIVMNVNVAYTIGYVLAWLFNFYMSAHYTFKSETSVKRGVGFALSHGINYVLHMVLLNLFLWLGLSETWAPVPVFCIVIPINFILVRYVFRSKYFEK